MKMIFDMIFDIIFILKSNIKYNIIKLLNIIKYNIKYNSRNDKDLTQKLVQFLDLHFSRFLQVLIHQGSLHLL